jgi:hypothetical protein
VPYGSGAFFGVHAADKRSVTWWWNMMVAHCPTNTWRFREAS